MERFAIYLPLVLLLTLGTYSRPTYAAEVIPPPPSPHYIVDDARILSPTAVAEIDNQLREFERATSNQLVVAIYPKIQSDDDIAAYAVHLFEAWKIGQKAHDNGVLLLASIQDRKLTIQVGYGLEGALPDATAKMIIDQEITPRFKASDYDGGIQAGVNAIIAATKGEYQGNGQVATKGLNNDDIVTAVGEARCRHRPDVAETKDSNLHERLRSDWCRPVRGPEATRTRSRIVISQ